jgi:hypothetical protein
MIYDSESQLLQRAVSFKEEKSCYIVVCFARKQLC